MIVLKFGGTSVGSVQGILKVKEILLKNTERKIVVCSAMSGVTDKLIALSEDVKYNNFNGANDKINILRTLHEEMINELINVESVRNEIKLKTALTFQILRELSTKEYQEVIYSQIVTCGEILLTQILSGYLNWQGVANTFLEAEKFMHIDTFDDPDIQVIRNKIMNYVSLDKPSNLYITQGFICRNSIGEISHLNRGGSDYSATIIGAALNAKEVQIWTDINGLHNNDPRYVDQTYTIPHITYEEASELAYFGAKVLHPMTTFPLAKKKIPILLKNTFDFNAEGTVISDTVFSEGLKGISAKDNIKLLRIESNTHLSLHSFFKRVFDIFDDFKTPVDMITTSKYSILLAIENDFPLNEIISLVRDFAIVKVERNQSIISIVGNSLLAKRNKHKLADVLGYSYIKMISYGASNNSVSLLTDQKNKVKTLQFLNDKLFPNYLKLVNSA